MPVRAANVGDSVMYRAASGETRSMLVQYKQGAAPATPASSTSASGGTLAAATYSYRISKVVNGIESPPSVAKTQVTTGSTSTVTVDWTATLDPKATAYKVYGRSAGTELLMATILVGTATLFIDDASVTPAGALPAVTTAVTLWDPYGSLRVGVAKATTYKGTNVYFLR